MLAMSVLFCSVKSFLEKFFRDIFLKIYQNLCKVDFKGLL